MPPTREDVLKNLMDSPTKDHLVSVTKAVLKRILVNEERMQTELNSMKAYIAQIKQGPPGQPGQGIVGPIGPKGDKGEDGKGVPGRPGRDGSPDTGEEIVVKINKDKSGKKIKKEHVEGLSDIEDLAKQANANIYSLRAAGDTIYTKDLSSQTNGVTKTFDISSILYRRTLMVIGSDFPTILMPNNGYTVVPGTLTLTTDNAPSSGSQLALVYVV